MGGGLQGGRRGGQSVGVSGALPVPGRDRREEHRLVRERPGHLPLPGEQNPGDENPYPRRRRLSVAAARPCAAAALAAHPQLRLFTPQQQAPDRLAPVAAQGGLECGSSVLQTPPPTDLLRLWRHHEDRSNAHTLRETSFPTPWSQGMPAYVTATARINAPV